MVKTNFKFLLLLCFFLSLNKDFIGQQISNTQIIKLSNEEYVSGLINLKSFLEIPNNGRIRDNIDDNIKWIQNEFDLLKYSTNILATNGIPLVFAEGAKAPDKKTVLFYLQIDGQPVDSSAWDQESPYQPVLKDEKGKKIPWETALNEGFNEEWRLYARSAADSKGPAMAFMSALKALERNGLKPAYNIKVIMDFQEELGSPDLIAAVTRYQKLFKADMMIILDGTRFLSNKPTLTFGARGIARVSLKVFGATTNLHSGHYGNFAPNPVFKLSKLLSGMKDENGKVLIPGYYEGVELSETDKKLINQGGEDINEMKKSIGIAQADQVGGTYQEGLQYPSLNVRGLKAAWVGTEVRTIIPNEAIAELDLRLVPETEGQRQVDLIKKYIEDAGYHFVEGEPSDEERREYGKLISFTYTLGSKAFRTELNSPMGLWLDQSMTQLFGQGNYVKLRTTGGSQPIAPFITTLNIPAVSVRIPGPQSQIHGPNENIRLGNFLEGIQMCLAILGQEIK